jgi:hypothetical protein
MQGAWSGCFQGYRGEAMQDLASELRRISIPRTLVNKGKKKGRSFYAPALRARSLRLPWRRESSSLRSST